jgi:hypothetical protein
VGMRTTSVTVFAATKMSLSREGYQTVRSQWENILRLVRMQAWALTYAESAAVGGPGMLILSDLCEPKAELLLPCRPWATEITTVGHKAKSEGQWPCTLVGVGVLRMKPPRLWDRGELG